MCRHIFNRIWDFIYFMSHALCCTTLYCPLSKTACLHMYCLYYSVSQNPSYAPTHNEKTITYRRDCLPEHPMEMHVHVHKIPLHDIFPWQTEDKKIRRRTKAISKWRHTCFPKAHSLLLLGADFTPFAWDGTLSGSLCSYKPVWLAKVLDWSFKLSFKIILKIYLSLYCLFKSVCGNVTLRFPFTPLHHSHSRPQLWASSGFLAGFRLPPRGWFGHDLEMLRIASGICSTAYCIQVQIQQYCGTPYCIQIPGSY